MLGLRHVNSDAAEMIEHRDDDDDDDVTMMQGCSWCWGSCSCSDMEGLLYLGTHACSRVDEGHIRFSLHEELHCCLTTCLFVP